MTDHQIIFLKLWVNKLAVICGKVSREMASTIPTMRRHDTMVSAMNIIRIYSNKATGIQMIGFRNKVKNSVSSTERMASNRMSVGVMVRMLPNRKADKSGVNPGARKLKIIPTAIPKVQNTAIAESSRISFRLLNHSTPKEESTEKIAADNRGEIPAYNPRPIPPKEAWAIPPLMNTKRRVTMYVPIIPQAMLANKLPSKACWKKV